MKRYRTMKTTMGRKYVVRIPEDEAAERLLFGIARVVLPLVCGALAFLLWFTVG